jgi:cellulose synthase/poly-beta-1,6-N-acetylglucosamine synthase-like glycosyltransferase
VFIPVYRESEQLFGLLHKLVAQDSDKEVVVTIDSPDEAFLQKTRKFSEVKFIINEERIGKSNALNDAVKLSSGSVLLFLDADVEIPDDPDFLKKIVREMRNADVLDIKKEVTGKSFLSRMAYYEYFTFNVSSWIASKFLRKCPATNGAAFAIKREVFDSVGGFRKVVAEDIDLATRAFLAGCSFAYTKEVGVKNVVHSTWKSWFRQRKRWAIGQALWTRVFYKELFRKCSRKPQIFLPALFFLYPSLLSFSMILLLPSTWMYDLLLMLSLFFSTRFNTVLPVFLVSLAGADILKSLFISFLSFAVTSVLFFKFSRKLGFKMKIHELFVYYFFYSPLWLAVIAIGYFQVFVLGKKSAPDWRT